MRADARAPAAAPRGAPAPRSRPAHGQFVALQLTARSGARKESQIDCSIVPGGRPLGLQAAQPLDRRRRGQAAALEQQLPLEQRPVQLPPGEDALARHAATLAARAGRGGTLHTDPPRRGDSVSWLTILIIVLVVLLVLGFFGRGRYRA